MTRPPFVHLPRVAASSAAVLLAGALAGCSGSQPPPPLAGNAPASTPSTASSPTPTPTPPPVAAETGDQAAAIAARVIAAGVAAVQQPGPEGQAARDAVFAGDALVAANADNRLLDIQTPEQREAKALTGAAPTVLAISRGADYPRALLVQTTRRSSGFPVLNLLVAADVQRGYQMTASASLLSNTSVGGFDLLTSGSPWVREAGAVGNNAPAVVTEYARILAYPPPTTGDLPFTDDSFAASVRQNAQAQAQGLGDAVSFAQTHTYRGMPGGFALPAADGGSIAFATYERVDTLQEKTANALTPSKEFTALTGKSTVDEEASQQSLEFLVFQVPRTGKASVVAASEQLYAASGR